ncbi:MAG: hypothetical protein EZS28_036997 [Streblomastix strix]|uniref:Uncharacterized protein n=1 Tax=Streblomastix strix TaxID=222440 RepID=A0A5J4U996_9EUKA|nr:MAG: hypothetical protein EZS28_036997 [Streblomastix strix]
MEIERISLYPEISTLVLFEVVEFAANEELVVQVNGEEENEVEAEVEGVIFYDDFGCAKGKVDQFYYPDDV